MYFVQPVEDKHKTCRFFIQYQYFYSFVIANVLMDVRQTNMECVYGCVCAWRFYSIMQKNIKSTYFLYFRWTYIHCCVFKVFYSYKYCFTLWLTLTHILRTMRVFRTIPQRTARQPAISPNSETQNSSFPCTAAFPTQQLSLHSQPHTAQTNRPSILSPCSLFQLSMATHLEPCSRYYSVSQRCENVKLYGFT
jgi:hypothetical protein